MADAHQAHASSALSVPSAAAPSSPQEAVESDAALQLPEAVRHAVEDLVEGCGPAVRPLGSQEGQGGQEGGEAQGRRAATGSGVGGGGGMRERYRWV